MICRKRTKRVARLAGNSVSQPFSPMRSIPDIENEPGDIRQSRIPGVCIRKSRRPPFASGEHGLVDVKAKTDDVRTDVPLFQSVEGDGGILERQHKEPSQTDGRTRFAGAKHSCVLKRILEALKDLRLPERPKVERGVTDVIGTDDSKRQHRELRADGTHCWRRRWSCDREAREPEKGQSCDWRRGVEVPGEHPE